MDISTSALGMLSGVAGGTSFAVAKTSAGINYFDRFGTSIAGNGDFGLAGRRLDNDSFQRIEGGSVTLNQFSEWAGVFDWAAGSLSLWVDGNLETTTSGFQTPGSTSATYSGNIRIGADAVFGSGELNPKQNDILLGAGPKKCWFCSGGNAPLF